MRLKCFGYLKISTLGKEKVLIAQFFHSSITLLLNNHGAQIKLAGLKFAEFKK